MMLYQMTKSLTIILLYDDVVVCTLYVSFFPSKRDGDDVFLFCCKKSEKKKRKHKTKNNTHLTPLPSFHIFHHLS